MGEGPHSLTASEIGRLQVGRLKAWLEIVSVLFVTMNSQWKRPEHSIRAISKLHYTNTPFI